MLDWHQWLGARPQNPFSRANIHFPCSFPANQLTFLELSDHSTMTNYFFAFHTTCFWMFPGFNGQIRTQNISSLIKSLCIFICALFKSHLEGSNSQHISTPTTAMLLTTTGTFHSLNCFGRVIYASQACT